MSPRGLPGCGIRPGPGVRAGWTTAGRDAAAGAGGTRATHLTDLAVLEQWLSTHDTGVFVLDGAFSQKVVVEFMSASLAAGKQL
jgi:hypothetical protein